MDGILPNISAGASMDKIIVASGFFDANWKIDKAFLNEGDKELRAKCATIVVNSDMSTKVVSTAQPSVALLNSYVGMYQIEGGPLLKVYLDNNTLRIAQGDQSFEMVAVSDNEFYVTVVNASLSFKKDPATIDYNMTVHQGGREYPTKKMK
jgi:hypothetical protein